jgi:arylsulfatase A-like enzyme
VHGEERTPVANIALVVLDTLRKDSFDEFFEWLPGTRFDSAWSPGAWTTPVHAALFGGFYPSELGVFAKTEALDPDRPVLAELLSEAGYTCRAFSANANISNAFNFDRGFDSFQHSWHGRKANDHIFDWAGFIDETRDMGPSRFLRALYGCVVRDVDTLASLNYGIKMKARDMGIEQIAGADNGAQLALERIRETEFGDDEFYFVNLMEAHGPYDPPASYRTVEYTESPNIHDTIGDGPSESAATIRQAYDDSVRYLSDVYADMFEELRSDFDYVITLGDHGELFGEDGAWAHNHGIYPGLVHVPLCVYDGRDEVDRRDDLVSLLDVHQTILDLAGVDGQSRGRDLFGDPDPRPLLVERYGLRSKRIEQMHAGGYDEATVERYDRDLSGVVLPEDYYGYETLDGMDSSGDAGGAFDPKRAIDDLRDSLDTASVSFTDSDVPEDVQRRLEELGYA